VARRQLSSVARCTGLGARVGTAHGSLTSRLSRPWWLTRRIGNPSPLRVESGFPAIMEPLVHQDYFPHGFVPPRRTDDYGGCPSRYSKRRAIFIRCTPRQYGPKLMGRLYLAIPASCRQPTDNPSNLGKYLTADRQVVHYSGAEASESPTFPMPPLVGVALGEPARLTIGALVRVLGHPTDRRGGAAAHATEFQQILNAGSRSWSRRHLPSLPTTDTTIDLTVN
jgi:hypothetical protein